MRLLVAEEGRSAYVEVVALLRVGREGSCSLLDQTEERAPRLRRMAACGLHGEAGTGASIDRVARDGGCCLLTAVSRLALAIGSSLDKDGISVGE